MVSLKRDGISLLGGALSADDQVSFDSAGVAVEAAGVRLERAQDLLSHVRGAVSTQSHLDSLQALWYIMHFVPGHSLD